MNNNKLLPKRHAQENRNLNKLINEILIVTMDIKNQFPEHYEHLSEIPLFLLHDKNEVRNNDFKQYLNTLKMQLKHLKKNQTPIFIMI